MRTIIVVGFLLPALICLGLYAINMRHPTPIERIMHTRSGFPR